MRALTSPTTVTCIRWGWYSSSLKLPWTAENTQNNWWSLELNNLLICLSTCPHHSIKSYNCMVSRDGTVVRALAFRRHMCVEFFVVSLSLLRKSGPPVFLPPQESTFQISIRPGTVDRKSHLVDCSLLNHYYHNYHITIFIIIIFIIM